MNSSVRRKQINVEVAPELQEVLEALCFLEGVSAAELLRPVILKFLRQQADLERVRRVLAERRAHRQETRAPVQELARSRDKSASTNEGLEERHDQPS